ncbi:hypothetical protein F5884DRAFT_665752 [Xylogone sp. PMI_703]|nr:hypothetical protein F5884DRAFT_665752 [Xylogone sp. PMI_703]
MVSEILLSPPFEPPHARRNLIYFLIGNPGCISYYSTFLGTLNQLLSTHSSSEEVSDIFYIYGRSLPGFEDNDAATGSRTSPYSLEEQIEMSLQRLKDQRIPSGPKKGEAYDNVIFLAHSLGCYMSLEILQRLKKSPTAISILGGILLFPTVMHLAHSPSGVKASRSVARIPEFPSLLTTVIKGLLWPVPNWGLNWLIRLATNMPNDGVEVTRGFLRSKMGIWQALHLLRDELNMITEDKWDDDIWGIEHVDKDEKRSIPKLFFYFGHNDHWVANNTRDTLIAARGKLSEDDKSSRPVMMIDENGVEHSFCLRHSELMAEKVKLFINDIIESKN